MSKRILAVVGTRPNFIKVTQFRRVAEKYPGLDLKIVHTGQHYDGKMADVFFQQFGLEPDFFLAVPPGSPNTQMAEIMLRLEKLFHEFLPDLLVVVGDVNSTLAAALTANKCGISIAHVESGLRSFDETMPEEFNRCLTDKITDIFFVTEESGITNLSREGVPPAKVHFVGNTMIDTMVAFRAQIDASPVPGELSIKQSEFVLVTMHRPATVDTETGLLHLLSLLRKVAEKKKVVFPVHPRTVRQMETFGLLERFRECEGLVMTEPLDYFAFQKLILTCAFIITDSGGIQEESTFAQVPCLTLRQNTERPVTVTLGTNELLPFDEALILSRIEAITNGTYKKGTVPPLWDGKATERIFKIIAGIK